MEFKTIDDFDFRGKKVFLRSDLNSDVVNGKVIFGQRIKKSAITIKELIKKGAKVAVVAHQGNPGKEDFISLEQHCKLLNKFIKIKFVKDIAGNTAVKSISNLKNGDAILLDNIRFLEEELNPAVTPNKIRALAGLFDIYVNDAFSVCHRNHGSITEIPGVIRDKCAGRLLEKEVKALKNISMNNCVYILGGAKPEENIKLLKGNEVLACGLFGQLCLTASNTDLGFQNEYLKKAALIKGDYNEFLASLKEKLDNVETPVDFAVNINGKRKEIELSDFPSSHRIDDIGSNTIKKFTKIIKNAPAIYMKGPAGDCSNKEFCKGTFALLDAVSKCKGFTLIGGGHLSDAIELSGISEKKFDHISFSGGALLCYIAGEKLPGLVALRIK